MGLWENVAFQQVGAPSKGFKSVYRDYSNGILYVSGTLQTDSFLILASCERSASNPIDGLSDAQDKQLKQLSAFKRSAKEEQQFLKGDRENRERDSYREISFRQLEVQHATSP